MTTVNSGGKMGSENNIPLIKYGAVSVMMCCFAARGTEALDKIDGTTRKEHDVKISKQHLKTSARMLSF